MTKTPSTPQEELSDLIRDDISLSKEGDEVLASRLQDKNNVLPSNLLLFFIEEENLVFCHGIWVDFGLKWAFLNISEGIDGYLSVYK